MKYHAPLSYFNPVTFSIILDKSPNPVSRIDKVNALISSILMAFVSLVGSISTIASWQILVSGHVGIIRFDFYRFIQLSLPTIIQLAENVNSAA